MTDLVIVDSGVANLASIAGAFRRLGATIDVTADPEIVRHARRVVLPGVGAFGAGMNALTKNNLDEAIRAAVSLETPLLGVCLGHQAIGEAYGGTVVRAARVMHGKMSRIVHDGTGLFSGIPSPLEVMRYHSLIVERKTLPACLTMLATSLDDDTELQAVRHVSHPVWGVQFHPESVLTQHGKRLLQNFLTLAGC